MNTITKALVGAAFTACMVLASLIGSACSSIEHDYAMQQLTEPEPFGMGRDMDCEMWLRHWDWVAYGETTPDASAADMLRAHRLVSAVLAAQ